MTTDEPHSKVDYDPSAGIVHAEFSGPRPIEAEKAAWSEICQVCEDQDTRAVLIDIRQARYGDGVEPRIAFAKDMASGLSGYAVALLIGPEDRETALIAKVAGVMAWNEVSIFEALDAAKRWLADQGD